MQRKWMLLLSVVVILSFMIAPVGTVQADMQTTSPDCPPYRPDRLSNKEFLYSLPQDCIQNYREMEQQASLAARAAGPAGSSSPDDFGYTYNNSVPFSWISATTSSGLTGDDAFTGPINIGFNFPFYGVPQSKLYISTNGLITFDAGSRAHFPDYIPYGLNPNNFIAAFWGDLRVGSPYNSGGIYYSQGGTAPNRYFVVEWRSVENDRGEGSFSFEAILYENGNILVQHQSLPSQYFSAVGIEGIYGEQGVLYQYASSGIVAGSAVLFSYPTTPAARISAHPLQPGRFTSPGSKVDFEITVTNTGTLGTDRYDLTSTSSGWPVTYYAANGITPLADTDGDSLVDTGPISAGSSTKIIARYHTPAQAVEGDDNSAHIQLTSSLNNAISVSVNPGMSVAGGFATVFQEESDGAMSFLTASKAGTTVRKVTADGHWGYASAVTRLSNGNYLYAWEADSNSTNSRRNIEYALLSPNGTVLLPTTPLVDNSSATMDTSDHAPSVAIAPDGTVGIVWYRYLYNPATDQHNYNIFFATLNASGTRLTGPTNITNNTVWGTWNDYNIPELWHPTIAATSDNRFIISWTDSRQDVGYNYRSNIWYAVYNTAGASVRVPTALTNNNLSPSPVLNTLSNGRVILLWMNYAPHPPMIYYVVLNSSGEIVKPATPMHFGGENYASSWRDDYDAVLLPNGKVAVAWVNAGVEFAILNPSYDLESGPHKSINSLTGYGLSIITNASNHVIMTWAAEDYKLAYALADSSGAFLTEPMVYHTNGDYVYVNESGQGSAPFTFSPTDPVATFLDVETDHWAWQFVERLVNAGVTAGCGQGNYCPDAPVTRDQMAVFLLKAKHGKSYTPPAVGNSTGFGDVPPGHWAAAWIKQLAEEGITGGCGSGNYCPGAPVTRDQMAVFLLKAKYGKSFTPPAIGGSTGFGDVPPEHWAAAWIKQLAAEGITGGCGAGTYCPGNPVNRAEMAVFLVRTFNLP